MIEVRSDQILALFGMDLHEIVQPDDATDSTYVAAQHVVAVTSVPPSQVSEHWPGEPFVTAFALSTGGAIVVRVPAYSVIQAVDGRYNYLVDGEE